MDLSFFLTVEAWVSLVTLIFLEIVLGVDNLVFISITTNRLPKDKQHLGRRLGLAGALVMRCLFLCVASWLVSMTDSLFTLFGHGFSLRDIILLVGGIYLIYKGIDELRGVLALNDVKAEDASEEHRSLHEIGLARATGTIMVMDIVFSIDSVITAVGLASHLIIMILAVLIAVLLMMVFIDFIANFLNEHAEMKILALFFIAAIGVLLVLDSLGIRSSIVVFDMQVEKLMVYFAMVFSFVITLIQMRYTKNLKAYEAERRALGGESVPSDNGSNDPDDIGSGEDDENGDAPAEGNTLERDANEEDQPEEAPVEGSVGKGASDVRP